MMGLGKSRKLGTVMFIIQVWFDRIDAGVSIGIWIMNWSQFGTINKTIFTNRIGKEEEQQQQ